MKLKRNLLTVLALVALAGNVAMALQDPAADPANGAGWGTDNAAGDINNVQCLNAGTGPGNPSGTYYWFAASSLQSNATYANGGIVSSNNGQTQISAAAGQSAGGGNTELISGNTIDKVLGGTAYSVYAQACDEFASANSASCSNWVKIKTGTFTTHALPTTPFVAIAKPDVGIDSITVKANVADFSNVQYWKLELDNNQSGAPVNVFGPSKASYGNPQQIAIAPAGGFVQTLLPNNRYQYQGQVEYFWDQDTPATAQVKTFTTTPEQPGVATVPVPTITHCSAVIDVPNASGAVGNPTYTAYQTTLNNGAGTQGPTVINGTGNPADIVAFTYKNLIANTLYTGTSRANNEDAAWNNSNTNTIPSFTTLSWGTPTPTMSLITSNSATYTISSVTGGSSLTDYQLQTSIDGGVTYSNFGVKTAWPGGSSVSVPMMGLTANTSYYVRIELFESLTCSSFLGVTNFFTLAVAPTTGNLTDIDSTNITAHWSDPSSNPTTAPNVTSYRLQYATDAAFATKVSVTPNPVKTGTTLTDNIGGLLPETTYYGRVYTIQNGGGADVGPTSLGLVYTPNQAPQILSTSCVPKSTTQATCTVTATDNGGAANLVFLWTVAPGVAGSVAPAAGNTSVSGTTATNVTTVTFGAGGSSNGTITVTDHLGTGPAKLSTTGPWSTNTTITPTTITIAPTSATVQTGKSQVFNATVLDQFGKPIVYPDPHSEVTWSLNPTNGGSLVPQLSTWTLFSATSPGSFTLTAHLSPAPDATASITVIAAGPFFSTLPTVSLNPDNKTGLAFAQGNDNVSGMNSIKYHWSVVSGPGAVGFSPNDQTPVQNANANNPTLTFSQAGAYVIGCTLSDSNGSISANAPAIIVVQVLSGLKVCLSANNCPASVSLQTQAMQNFITQQTDQFAKGMTTPAAITWSIVSGAGSINASGTFIASSSVGAVTNIRATANGVTPPLTGDVSVTVFSYDVSGAHAYPVPYKASMGLPGICFTNIGTSSTLRIYTPSGHKVLDRGISPANPGAAPSEHVCDGFLWNLENSSGEKVASGVYFFTVSSQSGKTDGKLIIIQ